MSRVSGVSELVRVMVLRGDFGFGGRLLEPQLAERLEVRRVTVREALRRLEGEGLLVADASGGMRVVEIGPRERVATLRVRAPLEALSTGLAAAAVRDGEVGDLALRELERLAEPRDGVLADAHFHRAVARLHGNEPCRDALGRLWDRIVLAAAHLAGDGGADPREHREIVAAIADGDEAAAAAVAERHALAAVA
jgi:DNA-binding GntR family transcriptional regulator